MTPRTTQEFLIGTSKQINPKLTARAYGRYRYSNHFWEDTNNNARLIYGMPAGWGPAELYIPNLADQCVGLGCSASSYVIAELDRRLHEVLRGDDRGGVPDAARSTSAVPTPGASTTATSTRTTRRPERRTTATSSSARRTSATAPAASCGTIKDGRLHGDRPHSLKLYGYYSLHWNATVGGFFTAQSGQVWEVDQRPAVRAVHAAARATPTGTRSRPAPAGPTPWYLVDLNYIQNIPLKGRYRLQAIVDVYNVFNSQTGYNYVSNLQSTLFNTPRSFLSPRRVQVSAKFQF